MFFSVTSFPRQHALVLACILGVTACIDGGSSNSSSSGGSSEASSHTSASDTGSSLGSALELQVTSVKTFAFSWAASESATHYRILENPDNESGYSTVSPDLSADTTEWAFRVPLHLRVNASYILQTCVDSSCYDSAPRYVNETLASGVGYIKATNTDPNDYFGYAIALSANGQRLAVGAPGEDASGGGINHKLLPPAEGCGCVGEAADVNVDENNNESSNAGAVYLYQQVNGHWYPEAYIKPIVGSPGDQFGRAVALKGDGTVLVVGAPYEDSPLVGAHAPLNVDNNTASNSGAAYVFRKTGDQWQEVAFLKGLAAGIGDRFGSAVDVSDDGNMIAIGAPFEDSGASGINGNHDDNARTDSGAVLVYRWVEHDQTWNHITYIKPSNTAEMEGAQFGAALALSGDGQTLAVGARLENGNSVGINQHHNGEPLADNAGAVYLYRFDSTALTWSQQAYVKASNTEAGDRFGQAVSLSYDGNVLAVGAYREDSSASMVNGAQQDNAAQDAGAAYVFQFAESEWSQVAYVKPSHTLSGEYFGYSVALDGTGTLLAVGTPRDSSAAIGLGGDSTDTSAAYSGAVHLFRADNGVWAHRTFVKALNTDAQDRFGTQVRLSADGNLLAVGVDLENGAGVGLSGDPADNSALNAGAVYLY